jgi:DNA-binding protein HU-beta
MAKLTKELMIDKMVESEKNLTKAAADRLLKVIFNEIKETVAAGDDAAFAGFGTFTVVETKERTGHNPRTGESIAIPAGKKIKFRPGKSFKDAI